jgi:hypothetical protein
VEERVYSAVNDAPYFVLDINRTLTGADKTVELALGAEGYNRLVADGQTFDNAIAFQSGSLPRVWQLTDTSGVKPVLAVLLLAEGQTQSIEWTPGESLQLVGPVQDQLKLAWVIPTDLYDSNQLAPLAGALSSLVQTVQVGSAGTTLSNTAGVPYVAAVKITNPGTGPYLVRENNWWSVRGAQRRVQGPDQNDYLKVYLPAGSSSRIVRYGYIDGVAKPGYGCQYAVALRDPAGTTQEASCTVRVLSVTPYLFAPRVEFAHPISRVELDGQPWHYFDGSLVFLPNETGTYQLHVYYGTVDQPALTRTFARVKRATWDGCTMQLEVHDPPWTGVQSPDFHYYGIVNMPNGKLQTVEGATIAEDRGSQWLIRFRPGTVRLICGSTHSPADMDNDGDVDQSDFGHFQGCLSGGNRPYATGCQNSDLDQDSDVDGDDLIMFLPCMAGPDEPPGC